MEGIVDSFMHEILMVTSPDLIIFKDGKGRWLKANPKAISVMGVSEGEYEGKTDLDFLGVRPEWRHALLACARSDRMAWERKEVIHVEEVIPGPDGGTVILDVTKVPLFHPDGSPRGLLAIGRDITEKKAMEAKTEYLANHDLLTNLPNRRVLKGKLAEAFQNAKLTRRALALFYVDMNRFKYVNDCLGPEIGDRLLRMISDRLIGCVGNQALVFRLGGNEFAVLMADLDRPEQAGFRAESIQRALAAPYLLDKYEIYLTSSMGISLYPSGADDPESLMKNADIALHLTKQKGKNAYQIFNPSMNIETYKWFTLENDLRKAVSEQQFELRYQPKVDAATGTIVGAEALLRWNHPEWGLVSPNEFISLAEETGLILPITLWVLKSVCRLTREFREQGVPLVPIAINLSAQTFMIRHPLDKLTEILSQENADPRYLEFEITEQVMIENEEQTVPLIQQLKEIGIKVSLDDFGTGYSSLSYLKKLAIDTIKIDKSFIQNITIHPKDAVIIQGIISLAKSLGLTVVAEGIEREEELDFLRRNRCDQIQGYLFSKPVSAGELKAMLIRRKLVPDRPGLPLRNGIDERRYPRIPLHAPLVSLFTILTIKGKSMNLGTATEALLEDVGLGGLRFATAVKLPVSQDIVLSFEFRLLNQTFHAHGHVVWCHEGENGVFRCGLEFGMDENERIPIHLMVNELSRRYRQGSPVEGNFVGTAKNPVP